MALSCYFTPVLAKHSKSFSLIDCISVGVDRMQRNFEPMRKQVEAWQRSELTDVTAKVVIYAAFVEGKLEDPKHLARTVHDFYFKTEIRGIPAANNLESFKGLHNRPSKNLTQFHNSGQPRNWANSWSPASHSRSKDGAYAPS
jgi:hypothetical protein